MRNRALLAISLIALTLSVDAAPRRRAVRKPFTAPDTVAGWLSANAHTLTADELMPYSFDLKPLRNVIGSAGVVGIGDGTHGTAEFYTMKLRFIDFMVREMGFDVVAYEAPFPAMNRIDAYVQGGPGNARELIKTMKPYGYFFWDSEELVEIVEWMREYNAHRGDKPAVHIAGFDIYEPRAAADEVLAYLRTADPPSAATAEQLYSCITVATLIVTQNCQLDAGTVFGSMHDRAADLIAKSSNASYQNALQSARVIVQTANPIAWDRDESMYLNSLWLREHRSSTKKMILWAHNAHLAKAGNEWAYHQPMGKTLRETLGSDDYFAIGTMTAAGTFRQWDHRAQTTIISTFDALQSNSIETKFRERGAANLLIPLRGAMPSWLSSAVRYNSAAASGPALEELQVLPEQYDAVIFIDSTTPITPIP